MPLPPDPAIYLWPENEFAWRFFLACRTQWHHGFNGETGLRYDGVQCLMGPTQLRVPRRRQRELWELLRAAELGFLAGRREADDARRNAVPS